MHVKILFVNFKVYGSVVFGSFRGCSMAIIIADIRMTIIIIHSKGFHDTIDIKPFLSKLSFPKKKRELSF